MKTKMIAIFSLLASALTAHEFPSPPATSVNVQKHFSYLSLDADIYTHLFPLAPLPIPNFSVGYRLQSHHFGWDGSLRSRSLLLRGMNGLDASFLGHYYPKPNSQSQLYVGAGIDCEVFFSGYPFPIISPEVVIGKEYISHSDHRRFLQAKISCPALTVERYGSDFRTFRMPVVLINYGFGF